MEFYYICRTDGVRYQMIKHIIDDLETARKDVRWLRDNFPLLAYFVVKLLKEDEEEEESHIRQFYYIFNRENGRYKIVSHTSDLDDAKDILKEFREKYPEKQSFIAKEVRGI